MIRNIALATLIALIAGVGGGWWHGYRQATKMCDAKNAATALAIAKDSLEQVEKTAAADRPVAAQAAEKRTAINDYFAGIKRPDPKKNDLPESPTNNAGDVADPTPLAIEGECNADPINAPVGDWRLPDDDWLLFYDYKQGLRLARP